MNAKQRRTLAAIFARPTSATIKFADVESLVKALGGTITGEHGVGLAKKPWLKRQVGDNSYALMRQIKHALDPQNLLNPGKIFD